MKTRRRLRSLFLVLLSATLVLQFISSAVSTVYAADDPPAETNTSDTDEESDSSSSNSDSSNNTAAGQSVKYYDGREISPSIREEIYYWDRRPPEEPDDGEDSGSENENEDEEEKLEDVIVAVGGLYQKEVIFRKDPKTGDTDTHHEVYTPTDKSTKHEKEHHSMILPVGTRELEYEKGEEKTCGKEGIPLHFGNDGYRNNLTLNVVKNQTHKGAYIDLLGDGNKEKNGDDFMLKWKIAITGNGERVLATSAKNSDQDLTKHVRENNDGEDPLGWKSYDCSLPFKSAFNVTLPAYIVDAIDNDATEGMLLGKKGMKINEWTRRIDNQRAYLAFDQAARNITMRDVCKGLPAITNKCNTRLSLDVRKCYFRAIGLKTSDPGMFRFDKVMDHEYLKMTDFESEVWMHSIKANTDAFVSCFALGSETSRIFYRPLLSFEDGPLRIFNTREQAKAYAENIVFSTQWPQSIHPIDNISEEMPPEGDPITTCSLGSIGWIMCPILEFSAKVADRLFNYLSDWMIIPAIKSGDDQAAYIAWKAFRDFGNILFAILILFTILVQVSGGSLSSYTIRKLAPRIIVVGILINISFPVASVLVDISNVLGKALYDAIHGLTPPTSGVDGFKTWEKIVVNTILTAGPAAAGLATTLTVLAALVPMLITSLLSMLVVFIILLFRQAAVILLIVISPIAIATKLLPGTENWYKKWSSTFTQLLFMYPALAIVFGGAYFASRVLIDAGTQQGGLEGALLAIFALAIQVIPLFITPVVMKIGGRAVSSFGGAMQSRVKGLADKASSPIQEKINDMDQVRQMRATQLTGIRGFRRRRRAKKKAIASFDKTEETRSQKKVVADSTVLTEITKVSAGRFDRDNQSLAEAALAAELDKIDKEGIRAAEISLDRSDTLYKQNTSLDDLINTLEEKIYDETASEYDRAAHTRKLVSIGDLDTLHKLIDHQDSLPDVVRKSLASGLKEMGKSAPIHLSYEDALRQIENGTANTKQLYQNAYRRGAYTESNLVRQPRQAIQAMGASLNRAQIADIKTTWSNAKAESKYAQYISPAKDAAVRDL